MALLRVRSNDQLDQDAKDKAAAEQLLASQPIRSLLADHIKSQFDAAEKAKQAATDDMMDSLRRRAGTYSPEHLAAIQQQGGTEIFMKLTEVFCNSAEALICDVALPETGDQPWKLKPTKKPSLPPAVIQQIIAAVQADLGAKGLDVTEETIRQRTRELADEARRQLQEIAQVRADAMADLVQDELEEGRYREAMEQGIEHLVTYGTQIIKGPTIEMQRDLEWLEGDEFKPSVDDVPKMRFRAVHPLKFFPSPGATTIEDATFLIEVDEFKRNGLKAMIGRPGWDKDRIEQVLTEHQHGTDVHLRTNPEQHTLERRNAEALEDNPDKKYQGMWFTGQVPGWLLNEWGLTVDDLNKDYEIVALYLGGEVVHCRINADPLGRRMYSKCCYKPVVGSFWGRGVPLLMDDAQDGANACARALVNNVGISSGPQVELSDVTRLAEGENITGMFPWKVWQFHDPNHTGQQAIRFFQPNLNADVLIRVFDFFAKKAEDRTGIPSFSWGSGQTGPGGGTASALSMLMNSANRLMKKTFGYIDMYVIRPLIHKVYTWNMLFIDDQNIKGDCTVEASGIMSLLVKEQRQLRLNEAVGMTSNPEDRKLMGEKRRAKLLRETFRNMDIDPDGVVPTDEEIDAQRAREAQEQAAQAAAAQAPAQPPQQVAAPAA